MKAEAAKSKTPKRKRKENRNLLLQLKLLFLDNLTQETQHNQRNTTTQFTQKQMHRLRERERESVWDRNPFSVGYDRSFSGKPIGSDLWSKRWILRHFAIPYSGFGSPLQCSYVYIYISYSQLYILYFFLDLVLFFPFHFLYDLDPTRDFRLTLSPIPSLLSFGKNKK